MARIPRQKGFTLLEIIVTLVIVGVLASLAVVSYQGVGERTRLGEAQSSVRAVVSSELAHEQTRGSFVFDPADLERLDSSFEYVGAAQASTGPSTVSVAVGTLEGETIVGVAAMSDAGECVTLRSAPRTSDTPDGYGSFSGTTQPCTGAQALLEGAESW